jgi:peptidoglycan/LPS O-acetylase OafA/YrhL
MRLRHCLKRENNNYDLLRLAAACLVIVGHAHALVPDAPAGDMVSAVLHFDYAGSLAVKFFFFLSGLVVTNSLMRKAVFIPFLLGRIFRIFPALIACMLIVALTIGPLLTTLSSSAYFSDPTTASFLTKNITLALQWDLPGVFTANPRHAVDGSLWTLPIEAFCYLVLLALGLIGAIRSRILGSLVMAAIIVYSASTTRYLFMFGLPDGEAQLLPTLFACGALLAINQDHCEINLPIALGLLLLTYLARHTPMFHYLVYASALYGALAAGASIPLRGIRLPGDFSYGVYLYGWPLQQCLVALEPQWGVHRNQAVAIAVALVVGALSWFLIERPAIRFGHRLAKQLGHFGIVASSGLAPLSEHAGTLRQGNADPVGPLVLRRHG